MNFSDKLIKAAENTIETFESGKKAQNAEWWDGFIKGRTNNNRLVASYMFQNFDPDNFYPTKDLYPYTITNMFTRFGYYQKKTVDLKKRLEDCGVKLDFSVRHSGVTSYAFSSTWITTLPEISFTSTSSSTKLNYTFDGSSYLETIEKLVVKPNTTSSYAFRGCTSLTHIILEVIDDGKIKGTWDFSYSPLDIESMKSIIAVLYDYSGTDENLTYSILFTDDCWANLEADSTSPTGTTWKKYVEDLGWLS